MKVGIMGGTFDPVHIGHLLAAECALEQCGLDEVWFMPTLVPPHKPRAPTASPEQRLRMLELAIEGHPRFRASRLELDRGSTSYTYETVRLLKTMHPGHAFYWIVGADMLNDLPKWTLIDELVESVRFIALRRPGFAWDPARLPETIARAVIPATMPEVDISSTGIRRLLAEGRSARYLLPEPVRMYVKEQGLYAS